MAENVRLFSSMIKTVLLSVPTREWH